jgi:hypothetical protein
MWYPVCLTWCFGWRAWRDSNSRERVIPLADWSIEAIQRHISKYPPRSCTLPWKKLNGKRILAIFSFAGIQTEAHQSSQLFGDDLKPALVTAGLIPEPINDSGAAAVTSSPARKRPPAHYFASVMLAGASPS